MTEKTHELEVVAGRPGLKKLLIALTSCATNDELELALTWIDTSTPKVFEKIVRALLEYRGAERDAAERKPPPHRRPFDPAPQEPGPPRKRAECAELGIMNPTTDGPSWTCTAGHAVHGYGFCHVCRFGAGPL